MNNKVLAFFKDKGNYIDKYMFLLLTVLTVLPIFIYDYFTLDGAAHVYNSNLATQLFFGNEQLNSFVEFNSIPVPNWTGHFLLAVFGLIFSPTLSEKLFLSLTVFSLLYGVRFYIKSLNGSVLVSYFVFPFVYSFPFLLGFYNFTIGLAILFWFLGLAKKNENNYTFSSTLKLLLLALVLYFSHALVFLLSIVFITITLSFKNKLIRPNFANWLRDIKKFLIVFIPSGVLFLIYHFSQPKTGYYYLELWELKEWFFSIRSVVMFNFIDEGKFVNPIFYYLLVLGVLSVIFRAKEMVAVKSFFKELKVVDVLLVFAFLLYLVFPNQTDFAGFFSVRLNLFLFLIILIWISVGKVNKLLLILFIPFFMYSHFKLIEFYNVIYKPKQELYKEMNLVGQKYVKEGSVVFNLNKPIDWFEGHLENYLGVWNKGVVVLDNYEVHQGYFPLKATQKLHDLNGKLIELTKQKSTNEFYSLPNNILFFYAKDDLNYANKELLSKLILVGETKHFAMYKV